MGSPRTLFVGLGNPGPAYAAHRHNIGFMALDAIARTYGLTPFRSRFQGEFAQGRIGDIEVLALKPMTFMNDSGRSVGAAARFFKLPPESVTVFHDDLDLTPGRLRVKRGGGHGGHNGLRSLDAHIGNPYRRVRLGIGHPGDKALVHGYVLSNFAKADATWLEPLLGAVAEYSPLLLADDDAGFMSKVALAVRPKRQPAASGPTSSSSSGDHHGV